MNLAALSSDRCSRPIFKIPLRQQRERSSSKPKTRVSLFRMGQIDRAADMITRVRNRDPMTQTVLEQAEIVTDRVSDVVFQRSHWTEPKAVRSTRTLLDLQTYIGLWENLAVNEGARSIIHESNRKRTPLGHAHREHIRDLSIEQLREM